MRGQSIHCTKVCFVAFGNITNAVNKESRVCQLAVCFIQMSRHHSMDTKRLFLPLFTIILLKESISSTMPKWSFPNNKNDKQNTEITCFWQVSLGQMFRRHNNVFDFCNFRGWDKAKKIGKILSGDNSGSRSHLCANYAVSWVVSALRPLLCPSQTDYPRY